MRETTFASPEKNAWGMSRVRCIATGVPLTVDGDEPHVRVEVLAQLVENRRHGLREPGAVLDPLGDGARGERAQDELARSGCRRGHEPRGVVSRARNRRIAHAPHHLQRDAAGRGGGGEHPVRVHRSRADGPAGVLRVLPEEASHPERLLAQHLVDAIPLVEPVGAPLGRDRIVIREAHDAGEALRAVARQHDVVRFLHDLAGDENRIPDALKAGNCAHPRLAALHHAGIEFAEAVES